jgi:YjjG family noncanonical pyrimidine nucleotidase
VVRKLDSAIVANNNNQSQMSAKKYTHLFFDLDNTIWDFNSNSFTALYIALDKLNLLRVIGSYSSFFKVYCEVNEKLWELYRQGLMTKRALSVQRFEESFERYGSPLAIGGGVVNDAYLTEMPSQTKLVEGAREVLDYLYGRYKIAIITNGFKEVQYDKIQKSELSKYFSMIFISEEVGSQKPGKLIFEYAIKSMNAPKKSSLMIGDSWDVDIVGAMNFGIDQIYYDPKFDQKEWLGHFFTANSQNLNDILTTTTSLNGSDQEILGKRKVRSAIISDLQQLVEFL